ncbi:MAG: hypothetical protein LBK59_00080 [Bifidobacteriaceae bacterium]|nr:hypothetical protein [Bifidobacteriaceae bacterium]
MYPFAYDWRLDVHAAARELARHIEAVVARVRGSSADVDAVGADRPPGGVILVAHSMGGLVVRALLRMVADDELDGGTRASREVGELIHGVVEVGVPARGSAKAVWAAAGRLPEFLAVSSPLAGLLAGRLAGLAAAAGRMPGVYDLLPTYPAVWVDDGVTHLDRDRLTSWGADGVLVDAALARRKADAALTPGVVRDRFGELPWSRVVGDGQPTVATVEIDEHGAPRPSKTRYGTTGSGGLAWDPVSGAVARVEAFGDGTVPRIPGDDFGWTGALTPTTQRHNSLQDHWSTVGQARAIAGRSEFAGKPLGAGEDKKDEEPVGIDPPPFAVAGEVVRVDVTGLKNTGTPFYMRHVGGEIAAERRGVEWVDRDTYTAVALFRPRLPGLYEVRLGVEPYVRELVGVVDGGG